ncbi:serine aminopeptidase domain-containing protein [Vulgatibacter sp.]|uniref:alpha/beta hydrolase family protein n=1 Tax=Vulgatibacter sp. TaxID=1971226 RepID=UPI00356134B4
MSVSTRPIRFSAADGYELAGELFLPPGRPVGQVLVAAAMGVPRRYYGPFATFLAEAGLQTLAFDYRGIGGSAPPRLRGFPARLEDWATLDLPAAAAELRRHGDAPLFWLGHSVGGQLFGLTEGLDVRGALFVASQSGYWRNWETPRGRLAIFAFFWGLVPALTLLLGKLPMRLLGQGEDLPAGVARQWAAWGRDPDYVLGHARRTRGLEHFDYRGPMRFYAIADDPYAPPRTVERLHGFFPHAAGELRVVEPAALGVPRIGHFGPFRPTFRETLWPELRSFFLSRAGVEIEAAVR